MKISIKSGRRGRPLELDIKKAYDQIIDLYKQASPRLRTIAKTSAGMRGESLFGTQTSVPDWIEQSTDLLDLINYQDFKPSYKDIKQVKQTIKTLQQLTSKQERVYSRALAEQLSAQYEKELSQVEALGSDFTKKQIKEIKERFSKQSPRQKQKILTSKAYQDPKTAQRYKRILKWAQKESGRKSMTQAEAWAYLFKRRLMDGLELDEYDMNEIF